MNYRKKTIVTAILLLVSVAIHFYSLDAQRVENGYSTKVYPTVSLCFRRLFGWLPFSIGDFLWGALVLFLLVKLFLVIKFLFLKRWKTTANRKYVFILFSTSNFILVVYICFNIFWGLNYSRRGIAQQLSLRMDHYSLKELQQINELLVQKVNSSKKSLLNQHKRYPQRKELYTLTAAAYEQISIKYPFLAYHQASVKTSMWGWLGNYMGFLGYYNPFTGEAQVNTSYPLFTQPFTACHEVAHQLGYAKEMEANFVGYLAASASKDTVFKYAVYSELFSYANRTLYFADSSASLVYRLKLLPAVTEDYKEKRKFNAAHTSFLEPIFRIVYSKYLRNNQQPMGLLSYDEVTAFMIAYYKKFGTI
jgi:hypothetical protein